MNCCLLWAGELSVIGTVHQPRFIKTDLAFTLDIDFVCVVCFRLPSRQLRDEALYIYNVSFFTRFGLSSVCFQAH